VVARLSWRSIDESPAEAPRPAGPLPAWRSIVEEAPAAPARAERPADLVIRGVPATEASSLRLRRALTVGTLVAILRRAFSYGVSAFAHLCVFILLVGVVVYMRQEADDTVGIIASYRGGGDQGKQDEGRKEQKNELSQQVEKLPDAAQKPVEEMPKPVVEPTPAPAPGPAPETKAQPLPSDRQLEGRGGSRRGDLLKKYGGTDASESAVERGLEWLASHQSASGAFDAEEFIAQCPKEYCKDERARGDRAYSLGTTALSVLAFLGGGYSHQDGKFAKAVDQALPFLLAAQNDEGGFSQFGTVNFYNHALCTWSLCEAYAYTRDASLKKPAQRGIDYLVERQYRGGGWDYAYSDDPDDERNDTSIAGWAIMAMKSAQMGGLEVPKVALDRAAKLIESRTDRRTGEMAYAERRPGVGRKGDGLVAVGMLSRLYLGMQDPAPLKAGAARLMRNLPDWDRMTEANKRGGATGSFDPGLTTYYWYYGTLAMFQVGGEYWERWNGALRDMLVAKQRNDGHARGSWDPEVNYIGREGGRIYATAINVLNLEIYYRYLPLYSVDENLAARLRWDEKGELMDQARTHPSNGERIRAMTELAKRKNDTDVTALLAQTLADKDPVVRLAAAKLLAERGNKEAIPFLVEAIRKEDGMLKGALVEQLGRFKDKGTLAFLISLLSDSSERVVQGAAAALKTATGQDFGQDADAWSKWWAANK
jgi:hypothetical protein